MRTIERASAFKRDYKRVKATPRHGKDLDSLVSAVAGLLLVDQAFGSALRAAPSYCSPLFGYTVSECITGEYQCPLPLLP